MLHLLLSTFPKNVVFLPPNNITSFPLKDGGIITNGAVSSSLVSFRESKG